MPTRQVVSYGYDAVGNRLSAGTATYSYDAADQLLTAGSTTYVYDGNGNQKSRTVAGITTNYSWDALNRLTGVSGGSVNTVYQYDGDGNRVAQQIVAGTYAYSNDTVSKLPVVLNESGPDGVINYSYGLSMIAAKGAAFQNYYQFDGLGSVAGVTDQSSAAKAQYSYNPWGGLLRVDPLPGQNKYMFTGQALDASTGLLFLRARYYSADTGRFLSRDPVCGSVDIPATHSKYVYALSNPVNYLDLSGLASELSGPEPDAIQEQ